MIRFNKQHLAEISDEDFIREILFERYDKLRGSTPLSDRLRSVMERARKERLTFVPHGTMAVQSCKAAGTTIVAGTLVCQVPDDSTIGYVRLK